MRGIIFLSWFILVNVNLFSQATIELSEVEVTASRIPQKIHASGRSIELIDAKALSKMPVNSIDELLRFVAGANVNSRNGFGVQADIGLRGSTFSQVLVLIDNVRFNDPLTGHFNNNFPVAIADIQQIEVIKGPAASSYGADAVGGVIHIKTKTYMSIEPGSETEASIDLSYGEHNLVSSDLGLISNKGKSVFSISFRSNQSDGEELSDPNFESGTSETDTYKNYFDLYTASISYSLFLKDSLKLYARASYDDRSFKAKYFYTRSIYDDSNEETSNAWSQFSLISNKSKRNFQLDLGYRQSTDFFEFNPLFAPNEHEIQQVFSNLNYGRKWNERTKFSVGAQFLSNEIESTDRGDHDNTVGGVYALLSKEWNPRLNSNLGMRAEYDENFGVEFLPQANLSYRVKDITLRASYGRSIRAADYTERYVSFNIPSLSPGRNAGNPDLKAERAHSVDIGVDIDKKAFDLSASIFYRASTDVIDFSLTPSFEISNLNNLQDSADYFYASNIASTDVLGFELSTGFDKHISDKLDARFDFAYTFIETKGVDTELSKYISDHPTHNLSAGISLYVNRIRFDINGNYLQRNSESVQSVRGEIPADYFISNAKIGVDVIENLRVYAKVFNLTNVQYQEILGARMPSRWISGGIKWAL